MSQGIKRPLLMIVALAVIAAVFIILLFAPKQTDSNAKAVKIDSAGAASASAAAVGPEIVGAGDIGETGLPDDDQKTGDLIRQYPDATVVTFGDNAYNNGAYSEYMANGNYHDTWGSFKARTKPSPGNHDYRTTNAAGYKQYFGSQALTGTSQRTYSAFSPAPGWRFFRLDSNIPIGSGSTQGNWLKNQLAATTEPCVVAYAHHALWSSGEHGNDPTMKYAFSLLDNSRGDLLLTGHDHDYERFRKQNASGAASSTGMVSVVAGTGGTPLRPFTSGPLAGTVVRNDNTHGIITMDLRAGEYTLRFEPEPGKSFTDSYVGTC